MNQKTSLEVAPTTLEIVLASVESAMNAGDHASYLSVDTHRKTG